MARPTHLNPAYIAPSAWWEHVPLAHYLIETLTPKAVVELGTHYGVSFFAFCQAAKLFSPQSFIYAVDTWTGDEHAGQYEDSIYQQVSLHQRINYHQISALLRQSFDDALTYFADHSIDLLHIDGLHTYDAVHHDFRTWLPKLVSGGTVLFHDTNVRERDFGVWKLWHEIKESQQFHCLEVTYGSGLGIATLSERVPDWHLEFLENQVDFQQRGALFLELAGKHLALCEAQTQNYRLAEEIKTLEARQLAQTNEAQSVAADSSNEQSVNHHSENNRVAGKIAGNRLRRAIKAGSRLFIHRYNVAGLLKKVRNKTSQILPIKSQPRHKRFDHLNVVFISGEAHTPGHLYRVERFAEAYAAIGASVTVLTADQIATQMQDIANCHILSLWRIAWSQELSAAINACHMNGGSVVFDVDDLMIRPELATAKVIDGIRSNRFDEAETAKLFARMQRTMLAADICVTTTEELASQMRLFGKPVMVLPNGYDEQTFSMARLAYRERKAAHHDEILRIGYASGSLTHQRDFHSCYPAVVHALQRHPNCRLVLFHDDNNTPCLQIDEFPELNQLADQIEWRPLVGIKDLPRELARFDINIIPLETQNIFTESKSELKFFEAALAGVCSIASPTGPFRRIIKHGQTGLLASSAEEWEQNLECLINNGELRSQLAEAAIADTLFAYGPVHRTQLVTTLATYLTRPAARGIVFQNLIRETTSGSETKTIDLPAFDLVLSYDQLRPSSVTVVIPLFNYADYIVEALESVRQQTLANVDLIVVDDQSTDNSLRVAQRWLEKHHRSFNRTILACNRKNSKLGPTRNVGFRLAESEYIFALDADNRLAPECLDRCYQLAKEHKAAYVYPTLREFGASSNQFGNLEYMPLKLVSGNYIDAMALVSKSAWLHVGGYRNIKHGWEDYELWCRFAEAGFVATHAGTTPLAYYRVHDKSMLRTTTDAENNKRELIGSMQALHPWLHISTPPTDPQENKASPAVQSDELAAASGGRSAERLQSLLPILRCPKSHAALEWLDGELTSRSEERQRWALVQGVPNLFAGLESPMVKDEQHISHPLPTHILERIQATSGLVLNLSAGGSAQKLANVVEVEFALFRNTDVIADAHALPFHTESFAGVVCMNAFEHYADPNKVASELLRVLKPGGWIVVQTAFLQPEHEYPWHFYNTTSEGLRLWFKDFAIESIHVSNNFNPLYALAWLAAECEAALKDDVSAEASAQFRSTSLRELVDSWHRSRIEDNALWRHFRSLTQQRQRAIAAGFELIANKPSS